MRVPPPFGAAPNITSHRHLRRIQGLIPAAAALALLGGCSTDPTRPGTNGQIMVAFASNRPPSPTYGSDIYLWELSTSGPAYPPPNVNTPSNEVTPALSGDGHWLAYNTNNTDLLAPGAQLVLAHLPEGTLKIPLTALRYLNPWNPSLSWDGRYLAVQVQEGSYFQLNVLLMDAVADTVVPTPRLHTFGYTDFGPALSGDGKLIAFCTNRSGSYDIALYDVAGDSLIALPGLNSPYSDTGPSISRDGRLIAFHSNRPGGVGLFDVYVYDRASASLLPLPGANTAVSESNPALSPDGRWLAFQTDAEGGGDIRLYDIVLQQLFPLIGLNDSYYYDEAPTIAQHP
jgi:Tol biopolymer transport system component